MAAKKKDTKKEEAKDEEEFVPTRQEYSAEANGVTVRSEGGVLYVETDGEVALDQTGAIETVQMLQAGVQAVS